MEKSNRKRELITELHDLLCRSENLDKTEGEKLEQLGSRIQPRFRLKFNQLLISFEDPGDDFWEYYESNVQCRQAVKLGFQTLAEPLKKLVELLNKFYDQD